MPLKPKADRQKILKYLEQELVHVLMQLDELAPIKFEDMDCEGNLYNFGGVDFVQDGNEEVVRIKLYMWDDKLPREGK